MTKKVKVKTVKEQFENTDFKEEVALSRNKKQKILCILLNENKTTLWLWKKRKVQRFSFNKSTYYLISDGMYISPNGVICAIYLEGISTPLSHKNIEKEQKTVEIINPETQKKENRVITVIKGLKFDSKLIDMLLNRDLFAEFTKQYLDFKGVVTIILLVAILLLTVASIVVSSGAVQ